jgi:hypothetical protein
MEALQQHRKPPPADTPSPDSTDPNVSVFSNVTFTSSISSIVRTLDRRRIWVLILKEFRNLLPSFMFILSITPPNLSIPDVPFPALLSILIKRRFQVKPATGDPPDPH